MLSYSLNRVGLWKFEVHNYFVHDNNFCLFLFLFVFIVFLIFDNDEYGKLTYIT